MLPQWAIPFNIHTPLCTRSIKFEPLRKKDQSADTNTPPQKLRNFCLTPQKKCKDQRMPMHTTPQKRLFQIPQKFSSIGGGGGGGVYIKWNGPLSKKCLVSGRSIEVYITGPPAQWGSITELYYITGGPAWDKKVSAKTWGILRHFHDNTYFIFMVIATDQPRS
jgi:hypothetical protein